MITRQDIVDEARKWVGTPWRHQGRVSAGIDCVGLAVVVAQALGVPYVDTPAYHKIAARGSLLRPILAQTIRREDSAPGALVLFWLHARSKEPQHLGIVTEKGGLIHADVSLKRTVEISSIPSELKENVIGYFDLPGVVD